MRTDYFINIVPEIGPGRNRTFSSDSGCAVHLDPLDHHFSSLESTVKVWQARLVEVVNQEVNRAEEVTQWATEALRHCNQCRNVTEHFSACLITIAHLDDGRREKILERWRKQMEGVLDFTNDLVECVSNDTKKLIISTADGFHELDNSIEEEEENEKEGRNTENLFVLPSIEIKQTCLKKGFQKVPNVFNRQENPPNMKTLARSCPSMKNISDDLEFLENDNIDDFHNWKLEHKDIEFEGIHEEEGHHLQHSTNSTSGSTQLFVNKSNYWNEKDSIESLMILMLDEEATNENSAKLKSPSLLPQSSQDLDVIFVSTGQEKDVLTNWNVWDKFGETWDDEYKDSGDDNVKISKKRKDINIQEVFWRISLSLHVSRKEPSHLSVIRNLPVWDSPDIFLDSSDKVTIKKQTKDTAKDPVNIFKSIRHIFNEPTKNIRQTNYNYKPKSSASNADTLWTNSHKFGQHWDIDVEDKGETVIDNKNVCIVKVFWKISLDEKFSSREPSFSNVIFNLPVRDWPDVMTDNWAMYGARIGKFSKKTQKDPVTIFQLFRHIFCEPETEDWIHIEKTGNQWEFSVEHEETLEYVSKKRKETTPDVDVMEVFWKLSLDENCCIKSRKHSELIKHFPAWFGPDVFEDSWDLSNFSNSYDNKVLNANKNKPKDPINIFKSCRRVFSELVNYKKKEKVEIMLNLNISEEEDFFQDWFVNVLNANKLKRNIQPDKSYLTEMRPSMGKKLRSDPDVDMARQEKELLKLLENWRI